MPFRPPLTLDQLHAIGVRQQASDVLPLLWEIKRLHAIVMRAYQLENSLGSAEGNTATCLALRCLRAETVDEPCLERQKKMVQEVIEEKASRGRK